MISKLNEKLLQQIANKGDGRYANLSENKKAVNTIAKHINAKEGRKYIATQAAQKGSLFPIFIAIALLMVLFEYFFYYSKNIYDKKK